MDKRVIVAYVALISDEDPAPTGESWEQSATGIDGTHSIHIHVDPANNTVRVVGFTQGGRESFTLLRKIEDR
jgi:hypothetical protein